MENTTDNLKPLTVQGILTDNNDLIYECLNISDSIYNAITKDSCLKEQTGNTPDCMMEDLSMQNKNLKLLKEILRQTRANLLEGGK